MRRMGGLSLVGVLLGGCSGQPAAEAVQPFPAGCRVFELSQSLCDLAVETAADSLGLYRTAVASIGLLGDPCDSETRVCSGGPEPRPRFVVRVRFTMRDGSIREESVYCGFSGTFPDCRDS